jgi:hypothetical protein
MDNLNFTLYEPISEIQAILDGGSGPFLPLTGGTLIGTLTMTSPFAISQPTAPVTGSDVTNKTYVDGAFQAKQPSAVAGNVAYFGSGANLGQTIDSGVSVDNVITNLPSNTTLWASSRVVNVQQHGAEIFKADLPITVATSASLRAFSTGNSKVGPATWPNLGSTYSMLGTGVVVISNSFPFVCYYRLIFSASDLVEISNGSGSLICQFVDESTSTAFGIIQTLRCLGTPLAPFTNTVYLTSLISVAASSSMSVSVRLTNPGGTSVTIDQDAATSKNVSTFVIERVA